MMYHDNDQLPEESQAADLITDLKDLYTLNAADAQSLANVRKRLHQQSGAPQEVQHTQLHSLIQAPIPTSSGKGTQMHQHLIAKQKTISWHQRINKFAAVLVTIIVVGALITTFTLIRHSLTGSQPATTGSSWISQPSPYGGQIYITSNTTAWIATTVPAVGGNSLHGPILRSIDGEKTWQDVTPPELSFSPTPYMLRTLKDGVTAWLLQEPLPPTALPGYTGSSGEALLLRTIDGGKSWQKMTMPQISSIWTSEFVDQNHGWLEATSSIGTQQKTLFSTTDGGETWQQISQTLLNGTPTNAYSAIQFVDQQTGWLASTSSDTKPQQLYTTHDAGTSWKPLTVPTGIDTSIHTRFFQFVDAEHGFVFNYPSSPTWVTTFYTTQDGGQTWQGPFSIPTPLQAESNFLNDHQIIVTYKNQIITYNLNNGHWVKSSEHAGAPIDLFTTTFLSATVGLATVNYTHPNTFPINSTDHFALLKTADGGISWSPVNLTIPTTKITPYTMAYITNFGWTHYAALEEENVSTTLTLQDLLQIDRIDSIHLPDLQAKKWLVRFACSASTAKLSFNGQQFSTPNCNQQPVSKIVTFDSPQSFQTLKVFIQGHNFWLVAIEACTNEQICQPDSN